MQVAPCLSSVSGRGSPCERRLSSDHVPKLYHAAPIGCGLGQMERDVSVEPLEERDAIANQDGQDRISNLVSEPETKAFAGEYSPTDDPNAAEPLSQSIHQLREVPRVELDGVSTARQLAMRQNEGGFVAVRPSETSRLETQRGLVGSGADDVAIDRLEERLGGSWGQRLTIGEFVRGLEPVDASVPSGDEAIDARRHVDRDTGVRVCHGLLGPTVARRSRPSYLSWLCRREM